MLVKFTRSDRTAAKVRRALDEAEVSYDVVLDTESTPGRTEYNFHVAQEDHTAALMALRAKLLG